MTTRSAFLTAVLPPLSEGEHYCIWGNKKENDKDRVRQRFVTSIEELSGHADVLHSDTFNVFFALAKFGPKDSGRYAANALALKSFFLDLDCGEGKPYATIDDGLVALKSFCKTTKLPKPNLTCYYFALTGPCRSALPVVLLGYPFSLPPPPLQEG